MPRWTIISFQMVGSGLSPATVAVNQMDAETSELHPNLLELAPDARALVSAFSDAVEQVDYKNMICLKVLLGLFKNSSFLLTAKLD